MAKVAFSKLKCKINDSIKEVKLNDEITIEVKQYLPIQEKLALIGRVVELAHEQDANYSNPVKASVYKDLEIVFAYTNLTFTDKQKEESAKLYDLLLSSGYLKTILDNIPCEEYCAIGNGVHDSIKSVYAYQNSALGILDALKTDYSALNLDIDAMRSKLQAPEFADLLKEIGPLLGLTN